MKKLLILLSSLLLLAGCSEGSGAIDDDNTVIFTMQGETLTKGSVYSMMSASAGANLIINDATKYIIDSEIPEVTEEMETAAQNEIDMYKAAYGDSFSVMLENSGAATEEEYIDKFIMPSIKEIQLYENFIDADFESYITTYKPRKAQIMTLSSEEIANAAKVAIEGGKTFEEVATENSSPISSSVSVVSSSDVLPYDVKVFIEEAVGPTLSNAIYDAEAATYYLVNITDIDPLNFKEEALEKLSMITDIQSKSMTFYFNDYNFDVYDSYLYNIIKNNLPDLLD